MQHSTNGTFRTTGPASQEPNFGHVATQQRILAEQEDAIVKQIAVHDGTGIDIQRVKDPRRGQIDHDHPHLNDERSLDILCPEKDQEPQEFQGDQQPVQPHGQRSVSRQATRGHTRRSARSRRARGTTWNRSGRTRIGTSRPTPRGTGLTRVNAPSRITPNGQGQDFQQHPHATSHVANAARLDQVVKPCIPWATPCQTDDEQCDRNGHQLEKPPQARPGETRYPWNKTIPTRWCDTRHFD